MQIAFSTLVFATVAAAVFITANRVSGNKIPAEWRYAVGWILAVSFVLPANVPLLRVEMPESRLEQMGFDGEAYGEQIYFPVQPQPPELPEDGETPAPAEPNEQGAGKTPFSLRGAVWSVYALGVFLTLFCKLYRYCRAVKSLQRCGRAPSERENEIYLRLCEKYGFRKPPVLLVCSADIAGSSVTFGFFRRVVLISDKFAEEGHALILEHELTHCKRRDSFFKAGLMLLGSLYWYNPVMHVFIREMHALCEQSCDEKLLKNSGFEEKKLYCRLLIEAACTQADNKNIVSAFKGGKKIMKKRIENILGRKSKLIAVLVLSTVILVTALTSAIYVATPPENIKVIYFSTPQQMWDAAHKKEAKENFYCNTHYNIKYDYSVDSDEMNLSGVVNGKEFNVKGDFVTTSYNGARLAYTGEDTLGNYNVKSIIFMMAQATEAADLPIQDHNEGEKARHHYFGGWFKEYAEANPQYKTVLRVALNPVGTDEIITIEIFIEDDFIRDFIILRNLKYKNVDEAACHKIEFWTSEWYKEHSSSVNFD